MKFIGIALFFLIGNIGWAKIAPVEFEKAPQAKSFGELVSLCRSQNIDDKYLSQTLQPLMIKRGTDLDVRGLLNIYLHCASDADEPLLLEKLSNELLLSQPRALIEGMVEEKTKEEFARLLSRSNHQGFDLGHCDEDCLKKVQKEYEDRMELISDLPLNSAEQEKRNSLLHEMRLSMAEIKKAEFELKNKKL